MRRKTYVIKHEVCGEVSVYATSTRKSEIEKALCRIARVYKRNCSVTWKNQGYFIVQGRVNAEYWIEVA